MAPTLDDVYGSVGYVGRERALSSDDLASVVRALTQLEVERSQSTDRSRKLLAEHEANQVDAAANVADTFTKLKAARIQGNSDAYNAYAKVLVGQMDTLSKTSWDVASREFAPLFMAARQAEAQNKEGDPKVAYWSTIGGGLLGMIKTPYGEAYADQLLATASQGGRDWRKELKPGTFEYQQMEDLERVAEENKQVRGNADAWVASINLKLGGGGFSASDLTKGPNEDAAIENAINRATNGMDVDTLKANVADLRSTVDNSGMDDTIAMLKKMLGEKTGKGDNSSYIKTLQHPEFQAWAKDHGFVVGQVLTNPDGSFAGVKPGKDDYIAAKGYVYQMKRDPTARQRRWRASHDIVRLDWNEGAMEGEKPRDPNDVVKAEKFVVVDADGSPHVITRYFTGDMSKEVYLDGTGATKTLAQVKEIGNIDKDSVQSFVLSEEKGLVHKDVIDAPDKLGNYLKLNPGEADVRLAAESAELKKASAGSPQYAYGVDLGLAGGHGVRVIIDEDGKRRTIPASAKVTRLESLTPEHVSELDKLRANRVNQAVKRTDALSPQQKEQQLGTPDEPMSLKEKIEEAKKQDMVENKAANEQKNESTFDKAGTLHAEEPGNARKDRAYDADHSLRARELTREYALQNHAEYENDIAPQGVPTSATLVDPEAGMSGVPGSEARGRVLEGAPDSTGRITMVAPMPNVDAADGPRTLQKMRDANAARVLSGGIPTSVKDSDKQLVLSPRKFSMSAKEPQMDDVGKLQFAARNWHARQIERDKARQAAKEAVPTGAETTRPIP